MNKVCVVGDLHFKSELSYSASIKDGRRSEWEDIKRTIFNTAKDCSEIVLMGDNLNARNNTSAVLKEFVEFLKEFGDKPVHILVGNHERQGETTALDFLKKINYPNWNIYTNITENVNLVGKKATFVPWITPALIGVETIEQVKEKLSKLPKADISFFHHAIAGTEGTEFFNEVVIDQSSLKSGMTFGGHIHKPQKLTDNIIVTGSVITAEVGEHKKSIWVWDGDTNNVDEIPLPVRGIYKINWDESVDMKKVLNQIPAKSITKCIVTNTKTVMTLVKDSVKGFDSVLIVEQYPNEREKIDYGEDGLDLSIDSLLKLYAKSKEIKYSDLKEGFELIK